MLRENGVMNAMISKTPELSEAQWANLRAYRITDAVAACCAVGELNAESGESGDVASTAAESSPLIIDSKSQLQKLSFQTPGSSFPAPGSSFKVVVWNFGGALKLVDGLVAHGCTPVIVGHDTDADGVMSQNPDGVVLSGGPGAPAGNAHIIEEIGKLCSMDVPIFGVGLGHQMLAIAHGANIIKLPFGHRGANQPVSEPATEKVFVTSQNHGYAVAPDSLPDTAVVSYVSSNDGTCEGINYTDIPAFSVQFSPTDNDFARFVTILKG